MAGLAWRLAEASSRSEHHMPRCWRPILLLVVSLGASRTVRAAAEAEPSAGGVRYRPCLETVAVVSEEAPVELAGQVVANVPKGRWFGVKERKGELLSIQVFAGTNLRIGWIHQKHVKALTDDDVDLTAEAIKLVRPFNPKLDAAALRGKLDALADRVAAAAAPARSGIERAQRISAQLYGREGFRYDAAYHTLESTLDERSGNCLSLSLLYLCAARKLKMPLRMLSVPRHALLRYDDGRERFNIEPAMMGMVTTDDRYLLTTHGRLGDLYPRVLSNAQALSILLADAGSSLAEKHQEAPACDAFCRAIEINPLHPEGYHNWGVALIGQRKWALACDKFARALRIDPYFAPTYSSWATALAEMGETQWASDKFARAAELDPRSAETFYNWGQVLINLGKGAEAAERLARAAALAPELRPQVERMLQIIRSGGAGGPFLPPGWGRKSMPNDE